MAVLITNRQDKYDISTQSIRETAGKLMEALGKADAELSLLIVDDVQIAEINRDYLGRTGPTNVIAFPMGGDGFPQVQPELLGDVVISVQTADREAADAGYNTEERFTELLIHGILHLLGYDHETGEKDAEEMEEKSKQLMSHLQSTQEEKNR